MAETFYESPEVYSASIAKGLLFVLLTSVLIFLLIYDGFRRILAASRARELSETALKEAQQIAHIGSFTFDLGTNILECTEEALRIAGLERERPARSIEEAVANVKKEDCLRMYAECERAIRCHRGAELIVRVTGETNTTRIVNIRIVPVYDKNDLPLRLVGTMQDITEQKRAEDAALESQSIYKTFINSSCDLVFMKDENLRFIAVNERMKEYYGVASVKQAVGKSVMELLPGERASVLESRDRRVLESREAMMVEETENGETYETILFPVFLANGRVGVGGISRIITARHLAELAIEQERDRAEMYLNLAPIVFVASDMHGCVTMINRAGCEILGRKKVDILGKPWAKHFVPEEDREETRSALEAFQNSDNPGFFTHENGVLTASGERRDIEWKNVLMLNEEGEVTGILGAGVDITELKRTMGALRESERSKSVLLANLLGVAFRCLADRTWTMKFVSQGCFALTGYQPEDLLENRNISFSDIICPEYLDYVWQETQRAIAERHSCRYEYEITTRSGERKWVLEINQGVYDESGEIQALEGIIIDITESKKQFLQIQYLSDHDQLTGLFNRLYYENAKKAFDTEENLPLTILLADINGLRLVNDAFGYTAGDHIIEQTAQILQNCCREGDVLARVGGDEFAMIMPGASLEEAYRMTAAIREAFDVHNAALADKTMMITLSIGSSTKVSAEEDVKETERNAEAIMARRKLFDQKSHHNAVLSSIAATMYERSYETESHAERLQQLCVMVGESMGIPHEELDKLKLLSMLHDIGKIGISDQILKKPGKLTPEEWEEMRKHPEIGYRIALSSPDFANVAEYILTHHERWDGRGYPRGLAGENIPVLSRILSVVDAYDAMTQDRVYHKAIPHEEAMEEIKRGAGAQFDPQVVDAFVREMQKRF